MGYVDLSEFAGNAYNQLRLVARCFLSTVKGSLRMKKNFTTVWLKIKKKESTGRWSQQNLQFHRRR